MTLEVSTSTFPAAGNDKFFDTSSSWKQQKIDTLSVTLEVWMSTFSMLEDSTGP
jgi:hypothetical protein